jgi:cell wall-associated NlpC family hydrolase
MFTLTTLLALRRAFCATTVLACLAWAPAASAAEGTEPTAEIVLQALALLGVPYRWGGTDPARGLDCSGLVRHVFKTVGAVDLPRRSEQMSRLGRRVARTDLRAGDLVFFNTLGHPFSHVAVYVGDGRFVHAPGRHRQVRVDALDERYWRDRFNGARRIDLMAAEPPAAAEQETKTPVRMWPLEDLPNGP